MLDPATFVPIGIWHWFSQLFKPSATVVNSLDNFAIMKLFRGNNFGFAHLSSSFTLIYEHLQMKCLPNSTRIQGYYFLLAHFQQEHGG